MVTQQLVDYIAQEVGRGVSREGIFEILLGNGWTESDIAEAFNSVQPVQSTPRTITVHTPKSALKPTSSQTIITFVCLGFCYPFGIIFMWVWMRWPTWVKVLFTVFPLIAIGFYIIFLSAMLISLNPAKQFATADNTKRNSDVTAILNAVHEYAADHGNLPQGIPDSSKGPAAVGSSPGEANICSDLVTQYLVALPTDPLTNNGTPITDCSKYETGYTIVKSLSGQITVAAPSAENNQSISATR